MCATCGCSTTGHEPSALHRDHPHPHDQAGGAPDGAPARLIAVEEDILARNEAVAMQNRARFRANRVLAINLVSSPGAGKTSLLVETLRRLDGPAAVIEGDQETSVDAVRIRETGRLAFQINTGRGCHLDAAMIAHACDHLGDISGAVLFIENVGNLVCPASFDLGEAQRVIIVSLTEGEDKPLKYPHIFATADLLVISKADLLPYLDCDVDRLEANARKVNPRLASLVLSAKGGQGMENWIAWLQAARALRAATG